MAWFALARVLFVAAVAYAAALLQPLPVGVPANVVFAFVLAALVVLFESRLRETAVTHILGALIGCTIGLVIARTIGAGLFWANTGDRRVEFLHSFILIVLPYLGLVLALVPPLVVGLVTFSTGGPVAVIVIVVVGLHLLAANVLIPKLVGKGVRLNAVASTIAVMFFGWLWGGMGLILGIPIVAVIKCVMDNVPAAQPVGRWLGD